MARTDTLGETLADAGELDCDALVVGGGGAGLSAATFLARYGFDTLVLSRGKSAIMQCAHLENYLGFPRGLSPGRFVELGRKQAEHEGATVREELVDEVSAIDLPSEEAATVDAQGEPPGTGGFTVETDEGSYTTRYVLLATAYDGEMLGEFEDAVGTEAEFGFVDTDDGRTGVDGLYAAGWMTDETVHQAIVGAGHGAVAGVSLVRDDLTARFWPEVSRQYVDWVVEAGRYAGDEEWHEHTEEWFERDVLVDGVDDDLAADALDHLKSEFRDRRLTAGEQRRRDREGQLAMLESLDDDVVREYVDDLDSTS